MTIRYAAATAALLAAAAARADQAPVTLARTFKAGESARYHTTGKVTALGNPVVQDEIDTMQVKEVRADGGAVLLLGMESGSYTLNGEVHKLPVPPPATLTVDRRDRMVKLTLPETGITIMAPEVHQIIIAAVQPVFPDKPVAPGDSWTTELDNPAVAGKKCTIHTTYAGMDTLDGRNAWKLTQRTEADMPGAGPKLTEDVTAWLDPATGQSLKYAVVTKHLPTAFGAVDSEATSVLLKPGDKAGQQAAR